MNFQTTLLRYPFIHLVKHMAPTIVVPKQNPSILPKLCQALKLSLQRFTIAQLQRSSQLQKLQKQKKTSEPQPQIIELISSDEEELQKSNSNINQSDRINEGKNKLEIIQIDQKTDFSKDHAQIQKESPPINCTVSNVVKKTCLIKKQKYNKNTLKLKKHKYSKIESKLDMTETANIKTLPFSGQQLNKKRQALLMRKVLNWQEAGQYRKERRQIRMLMN